MEVPFQRDLSKCGLIRLELIIDNNPFYFMLDTGATTNFITQEAAWRLGDRVRIVGVGRTNAYGKKLGRKEQVAAISIEFNDEQQVLEFNIMRDSKQFYLLDKSGFHLDGILGSTFLYRCKAVIDYADLVIRFDKDREQKDLEEID